MARSPRLSARVAELEAQLEQQTALIAGHEQAIAANALTIADLQKRKVEAEVALAAAKAALATATAGTAALTAQLAAQASESSAAILVLKGSVASLQADIAKREQERVTLLKEIARLKSVIGSSAPGTPTPAPPSNAPTLISPGSFQINSSQSGAAQDFTVSGGLPDSYTTPTIGGADAGLFTAAMVGTSVIRLTLTAPHAAGTLNITLTAANTAGTGPSPAQAIVVTVVDPVSSSYDFPTGPTHWTIAGEITLSASFPVTVSGSSGTAVALIPNGREFTNWAGVEAALLASGGNIMVNLTEGGVYPEAGVWAFNVGFKAPMTTAHTPATYIETASGQDGFKTDVSWTAPLGELFVKGVIVGPPQSTIDQDQAFGFNSGGPYVIQGGDAIVSATSGTTCNVLKVFLDSGSWAAGTAAGRLVLHNRIGIFSGTENLNVGANLNVATLVQRYILYGPRAQQGGSGFRNEGLGKLTAVDSYVRNMRWNGIYAGGNGPISGATARFWLYGCKFNFCGTLDTEHNLYPHNQVDMRFINCVTVNPGGGGHALKSETYRLVAYKSAMLRDDGELNGIAEVVITAGGGTQAITLDGYMASGGTVTFASGKELVRVFAVGVATGRTITLVGTDFGNTAQTEIFRLGQNGVSYSSLRYKTLTSATIGIIAGQTVFTGQTLYLGTGIGNPGEDTADVDYSEVQDARFGFCYMQQRSIATTGGQIVHAAARSSKYGGWSPTKSPPFPDIDNNEVGGGDKAPWGSNNYSNFDTEIEFNGLCSVNNLATASTLAVNGIKPMQTQSPNKTLSTGTSYTWRILRNDDTVLEITANPTTAGAAIATVSLASAPGGILGGGGAATNNKVAIKVASEEWDYFQIHPRYGNRADPDYFYGKNTTRGVRDAAGLLDIVNKQHNFDTTYLESCMFSSDCTSQRTMMAGDGLGRHFNWGKAAIGGVFPLPPFNRPAGPYSVAFTSAGTYVTKRGDTITGATSAATGLVGGVKIVTGSFAAGDAVGTIYLQSTTGTFVAENLNVGASTNVATIAGAAVLDWPNVTGAATLESPLTGDLNVTTGTQPVGFVDRDNPGAVTDYVKTSPWMCRNISLYQSSRSSTVDQFGGVPTPSLPHNIAPIPIYYYINAAGALIKANIASDQSPMPDSVNTITVGTHAANATKIYVVSTAGIIAGNVVHIELKPHLAGYDQMWEATIASVGSDGGGPFINLTGGQGIDPLRPSAIAARCEVAAFVGAGTAPAYFVSPANYLVQ